MGLKKEDNMKKVMCGLMAVATLGGVALQTATAASAATGDAGTGEVKVTYNANVINPDVGSDPDFMVLIPSAYQLSDKQQIFEGSMKLVDKDDYTKDYAGTSVVDVTVQSANSFKFANGGAYRISDENGATVWDATKTSAVTLKAGSVDKTLNAQLTKKADKTKVNIPSSDKLTFSYSVQ